MAVLTSSDALKRLFAATTEHTFQVDYGVADPPLIDYLSDLLVRFSRLEMIFKIRDIIGQRLEAVADMLMEAEHLTAKPKREIHRHIGDFTLFWVGVYPENLKRLRAPDNKDALLDYVQQGKRSYWIASTYDEGPYREEAPVLRRLSDQFDLCTNGLHAVRKEWERTARTG